MSLALILLYVAASSRSMRAVFRLPSASLALASLSTDFIA